MQPLDQFGRRWLTLVLEIEKHIDGYIDAYLGPPALRAAVEATPSRPPAALLDDLAWLRSHRPSADPQRARFLDAALRAIETTLRLLDGEAIAYLDEVERIYDIEPTAQPESRFTAAHRALDDALPGPGTLAERLTHFRTHHLLDDDKVLPIIDIARDECRRRTAQLVDLIPGETIEVRLVKDKPWGAYNWFLGQAQSLIEFNTDHKLSVLHLTDTFAHEAYPGHHTEHQLKEQQLWLAQGWGEAAAALLHSPTAVIAEAIATTARAIIFPENDQYEWMIDALFPVAGIEPAHEPEALRQISRALADLRYVSGNAAIQFHTGALNESDTIDYIATYRLVDQARAASSFRFISHPLFRSYPFTYTAGYDLLDRQTDRQAAFMSALTTQVLPSQLAAAQTEQ